MSFRINKIHLIISIIAALTLLVGFLFYRLTGMAHGYLTVAMWLSFAICLFYVIGLFARQYLKDRVFVEETVEPPEGEDLINAEEGVQDVMQEGPLAQEDNFESAEFDDDLL